MKIIYNHRFNDRWSISCLETNNYLYYHATPNFVKLQLKYTIR